MNVTFGRKVLAAVAVVGASLSLGACSSMDKEADKMMSMGSTAPSNGLWGVSMAKGVELPPSAFPGPDGNPPALPAMPAEAPKS